MAQTILHRRSAAQNSELGLTLADLPDEWMVVSDCTIGDGPMVAFVLLHPAIGLALVDCAPQRPADAIPFLEAALEHERFADIYPGSLPIAAVQLASDEIADVGDRLAESFDVLPACDIADPDWCRALVDLLLAGSEVAMAPIRRPEEDSLRIPAFGVDSAAPARRPAAEASEIPPEIVAIVAPAASATAAGSPYLDLGGSGRMPLSALAAPRRYRGVRRLTTVVAVLALLVLGGAYLIQAEPELPALLARLERGLGLGPMTPTPTAENSLAPTVQAPATSAPPSPVASAPATPQPVAPPPKIASPAPVALPPVPSAPAIPAPVRRAEPVVTHRPPAPSKPEPVITHSRPMRAPAAVPAATLMPPLPAEKPVFHRPAPRRIERRAATRTPERLQHRFPAAPVSHPVPAPAPQPSTAPAAFSNGDLPPINAGDLPSLPPGSAVSPPTDGTADANRAQSTMPPAPMPPEMTMPEAPSESARSSGPPMRLFPAAQ